MSTPESTVRRVPVAVTPDLAFRLVADAAGWPMVHGPAVHTEVLETSPAEDVVREWVTDDGRTARPSVVRRRLYPAAGLITFEEVPEPGGTPVRGSWTFEATPGGAVAELRYEPAGLSPAVEREVAVRLDSLARAADRSPALADGTVEFADVLRFEDSVLIAASGEAAVGAAYRYLWEADRWPGRMVHVVDTAVDEQVPGVQLLDMTVRAPNGRELPTRSLRVSLSPTRITFKSYDLEGFLSEHLGDWTIETTADGVVVTARHTAVVKAGAARMLGPDATVDDVRGLARAVLGANSGNTLAAVKAVAEEFTHV